MKRSFTICALALSVLHIIALAAPAPPKFAGVWVLNRAKSEGLTGGLADAEIRLYVSQDDQLLSAEQRAVLRGREQPAVEFTYKLDGSETLIEVARPLRGTVSLRAKWNEATKMLELTAVNTGEVADKPMTITTREQWQLLDGGKALRITRTRETPQGRQQSKLYFDKQ